MTDKIQKIREEVEKLKSQLIRGACSSQVAMETRCKEEAYNEVLAILDSMQEEPTIGGINNALIQDCLAMKSAAESLGISPEEHDKIVDECLYGKEPELVDDDDLPNKEEEPTIPDVVDEHYWEMLGEEPVSEELKKAIDTYPATYFGSEKEKQEWPFLKKMAIHFAKWQKQKDSILVSEELEEASLEYFKQALKDGDKTKLDAFKAGAKWQKEKEYTCYEEAFEDGAKWKKEQMMTKSIEAVVSQVPCSNEIILYNPSSVYKYCLPQEMNKLGLNKGDKIKVIVIKED